MLLINGCMLLGKFIARFVSSSFRSQVGNEKYFTGRLLRSLKNTAAAFRYDPRTGRYLLAHYVRKGMTHYRTIAKYFILILIPLTAGIMTVMTVNHFSDRCIALRIDAGGETLGYAASESDYLEARNMAKDRLRLNPFLGDKAVHLLPEVTYKLALIDINKYTGTSTLCDRLIESSEANIVNACGIYIDDNFLCAVKNESDAKRVFNSVLENDPSYGDDGIVTFVQNIKYIDGLYPDSEITVWDSSELADAVTAKPGENDYCYSAEGDTFSGIAAAHGLTAAELSELNPDVPVADGLPAGTKLLIHQPTRFLTVKVVKTEVTNKTVPFKTVEIQSDALYVGSKRTVVSGVNGVDQITNLVTYIDGEKVSEEEVSRLTVKEPVDKRVQVGTKALDAAYNYSQNFGGVLMWPAVNAFHINSSFGPRWGKFHKGLDIGSSSGTSLGKLVVAAAGGTVTTASEHYSYGYYVIIDHGNGFSTLYAHCLPGSLMVRAGDHVDAGQAIARVGQSGAATGPHLHFEVRVNGTPVNPSSYLGLN